MQDNLYQAPAGLLEKMKAKIAEIAAVADQLPGVVIIHNNFDRSVAYMSKRGLEQLGVTLEEIIMIGPAYHERFFNMEEASEYVPKIFEALERNDPMEWVSFFQQVKTINSPDWIWFASCTKIFMHDESGQPLLSITFAIPLDSTHLLTSKIDRLKKENDFLRNNYHKFSTLTSREKAILQQLALGKSSAEIASALFISIATVDTHRKNIRKKLEANSSYELSQYAMAFDLI